MIGGDRGGGSQSEGYKSVLSMHVVDGRGGEEVGQHGTRRKF